MSRDSIRKLAASLFMAIAVALVGIPPCAAGDSPIRAVDSVTITVSDVDRALDFYEDVLTFEKVSEVEVTGEAYERLTGVFGLRMRVARMRLGDEFIELMEVMTPKGRPLPADSRSNDLWFQHVAVITPDMDRAFEWLRAHDITYSSPEPQTLPDWNPNAGGIKAFYFKWSLRLSRQI